MPVEPQAEQAADSRDLSVVNTRRRVEPFGGWLSLITTDVDADGRADVAFVTRTD